MPSQQALAVLVIEDSLFDRRLLESMLLESANPVGLLKCSETLKGAMELLNKIEFDVAILDLNLSDSAGSDTLAKLHESYPNLAIVINTGAYEDDLGVKTLKAGAQDFLVKGKYNAYVLNKTLFFAVERKRIELELINAQKRIKETQFQLIQAEKMKVVGGLASGVAHEVKNPLATIMYGLTYLSQQFGGSNQKVDSVITNMQEAVDKANAIITDLLNFSGQTRIAKKKENVAVVVDKAIELVNHEFSRHKVMVTKHMDKTLPKIDVDRNRIEQVLINLLLNAVHAMPNGGKIRIEGSTRVLLEDLEDFPHLNRNVFKAGDHIVVLTIEDDGPGIPTGQFDKVFDPFFTTRRNEGGVGLGLSVSKNIMDIHEAGIFLENIRNGGARATLVFKCEPVKGGVLHG